MLVKGATGITKTWFTWNILASVQLWNRNVILIKKKNSSLAALEVVKMTTSSAVSDENFFKIIVLLFQSYDCPVPLEWSWWLWVKISQYQTTAKQNKAWIMCVILGICYYFSISDLPEMHQNYSSKYYSLQLIYSGSCNDDFTLIFGNGSKLSTKSWVWFSISICNLLWQTGGICLFTLGLYLFSNWRPCARSLLNVILNHIIQDAF